MDKLLHHIVARKQGTQALEFKAVTVRATRVQAQEKEKRRQAKSIAIGWQPATNSARDTRGREGNRCSVLLKFFLHTKKSGIDGASLSSRLILHRSRSRVTSDEQCV